MNEIPAQATMEKSAEAVVDVRDLSRTFDVSRPWLNRVLDGGTRHFLRAVQEVSFEIARDETFALVGESGSGKSTVAKLVVGLLPPSRGSIRIDGLDMQGVQQAHVMRDLRRRIQMIFQDSFASLNPR